MDEKRAIGHYNCENQAFLKIANKQTVIEVIPKERKNTISSTANAEEPGSPSANSKKKQKMFIIDVQKGNVEKVSWKTLI
jgi:hypothetical protein